MNIQNNLPAKISKKDIPSVYRWIAPTHDWLAVIVESRARRRGLELCDIHDGQRILEVAVGTGLSFQHILKQNAKGFNVGLDLTPAMLKKAKHRIERLENNRAVKASDYELMLGDAYALPFPDKHFDCLLNSYMFDLLPESDFVPVLREFWRVLKPGGVLVQINMTRGTTWYNGFWEGLYRLHPVLLGGCRGVYMAPYMDLAGFTSIDREYYSQWTFPSEVLRAVRPT